MSGDEKRHFSKMCVQILDTGDLSLVTSPWWGSVQQHQPFHEDACPGCLASRVAVHSWSGGHNNVSQHEADTRERKGQIEEETDSQVNHPMSLHSQGLPTL